MRSHDQEERLKPVPSDSNAASRGDDTPPMSRIAAALAEEEQNADVRARNLLRVFNRVTGPGMDKQRME
jgi:hypothetical protein